MFSSTDQMLPYLSRPLMIDRRWKPGVELAPNCPRCNSSNTKFCYYNNYSLTQPRYFCKGCRRYWTKGGSLRNVPVGGGCRKHRRAKSVRISSAPVGAREVSHARQPPPSSLRPDLALDEIVGSTSHMNGSSSISLLDVSSSDGSSIDLAELYAKFLNQSPAVIDPMLAVPELPVEIVEPFGLDSSYQMPVQLLDQHSFGQCQKPQEPIPEAMVNNELNFCLDPSGFEPLAFPVEGAGGDMFSSSYSILPSLAWQAPKHQEFGSVTGDDNIVSHQNPPIGDWATLDQPSFDALYTPLL